MGILPFRVFTHHTVGIAVAVTLLVSLIHHVDAPAVAEFIEVFAIGIVRGAQEVDIRLLHQRNIFFIGGIIDIATRYRMVVVTVHATQLHILAVNLKHLANTFHTLHAQMVVEVLVAHLNAIWVEVWLFGRPQQRFIYGVGETHMRSVLRMENGEWRMENGVVYIEVDTHILGFLLTHVADGDVGCDVSL